MFWSKTVVLPQVGISIVSCMKNGNQNIPFQTFQIIFTEPQNCTFQKVHFQVATSKSSYLKDIISLNSQDGLFVKDSSGRNRHFENVRDWIGKRGQAGKIVPKGFPRQ